MKSIIDKYSVTKIFHFTDEENIISIKKHGGLLSIKLQEEKGVKPTKPGGNKWSHDADKLNNVDKYVHLCFANHHPMQYIATQDGRIKSTVWLEIDPSVLLFPTTMFTSNVANKSGVNVINGKQAASEIDFEALYCYLDWREPENKERRAKAEKSEILVLDFIPLELIRNI